MFTGIISDIGEVAAREGGHYTIRTRYPAASIAIGCSIACDGCCLTVTSVKPDGSGSLFAVDVSNETCSKTTLGAWTPGRPVNLERALTAGDEMGGHIVTGHIDGLARIVEMVARWREPPPLIRGARASCTLRCAERFGCPRWHLAHCQRGVGHAFWRQPHPAHLDGDDVGEQKARRQHKFRGRPFRALRGAPDGVPSVTTASRHPPPRPASSRATSSCLRPKSSSRRCGTGA